MKLAVALLVATLLVPLLLLAVAAAGAAALARALNPLGYLPGLPGSGPLGPFVQAVGPVYYAGTSSLSSGGDAIQRASIHDLGFGPSDTARVERLIAALNAHSPLIGQGEIILHLGQTFGIDPLLIAQWQLESNMGTVGINSPGNGGNMIWAAAKPYADRYGCTPGPSTTGHQWAACPSVGAGLGIWFNYVGIFYKETADLADYARIYDPCSDPGNAGLPCGDRYAGLLLDLVRTQAGPPVLALVPAPGRPDPGTGDCVPRLPVQSATENLTPQGDVSAIMQVVFGNRSFPVTQGYGISSLGGEPAYLGYPHFHTGIDWGAPMDTPLYAPAAAIAEPRTYGGALIESLHMANGYTWNLLHLDKQVAHGLVEQGQLIGYSGNTGYSTGPHLHIELVDPHGQWVPPEEWSCHLA
ncbi:MAG: M23 family metallopeptidase [Thermomicrobiales bacterium]